MTIAVLVWIYGGYAAIYQRWLAGAVFSFVLGVLIYGRRPPDT